MAEIFNFKTGKYEPYTLPDESCMYATELERVIECASCRKNVIYGECFNSLIIHNQVGLGYMVCEDCYDKEWDERREFIKKNYTRKN